MPSRENAIASAARLMSEFAERTGLTSGRPPHRYLWTDAFAVCNLLGLGRATGHDRHVDLALQLIDQVHHVLGRYREDDSRRGWLSGDSDAEGEAHPTRGGLRIGKPLPERRPGEPFDEQLEWERDGQYFHYLTKWIHALDQTFRATGEPRYRAWALELASAAHRAFTYRVPGQAVPRMVWKMSTDLSWPLVPSMGHHDPLDGLITCAQLQTDLATALGDFAAMCHGRDWVTVDPLGLGGLMADAFRIEQLVEAGAFTDSQLLDSLLGAALDGLTAYERQADLRGPASTRLGFRELGLAIGLRAVQLLGERARSGVHRAPIGLFAPHFVLGDAIEAFWLDARNQRARTWSEHRDINEVMLATCLVPEGFLLL